MKNIITILSLGLLLITRSAFADFSTLSEVDKKIAIANFIRYNSLPDTKKSEIKENWNKFNLLPQASQLKIEKKFVLFKKLSPQKRERLIKTVRARQKVLRGKALEKRVEGRLEKKLRRRRGIAPPPPPPATTTYPPHN